MARLLTAAQALEELEEPWRARGVFWTGDPSATWVWLATSLRGCHPRQRVLVLGAPERPVACLHLSGRSAPIAVPLARVLDRFAWAPGTEARERDAAVAAARMNASIFLPHVPVTELPAAADGSRISGCCVVVAAGDWASFLERRPQTLRRTLRRANARLGRTSGAPVARTLAAGETAARLDELASVEAAGHRERGRILSGPRRAFLKPVIAELDAAGHVRTHVFEGPQGLDAYLLGFAANRRYVLYLTALRASRRELALGTLLLQNAVCDGIERGELVDVGNGLTRYKLRWATGVLPVANVLIPRRAAPALPP